MLNLKLRYLIPVLMGMSLMTGCGDTVDDGDGESFTSSSAIALDAAIDDDEGARTSLEED